MNRAACNILRSRLNLLLVFAFLLTPMLSTRPAAAQDAAAQAAQQASDAAMQASQQAMQNAQQASQQAMQASQQAMQAAQAAAMDNDASFSSSNAQQRGAVPSLNMPVPPQVRSAHTIFLANDGSAPNFPIDPNVAYEAVYRALESWGHYQIAASAQQADLIFQLHGVAPITDVSGGRGGVTSSTSPAFQLVIRDPKTNTRLWTITSPVVMTGKKSARDYWQNVDITNLVSRVKVLAGQPLSAAETASLTTYPKDHTARNVLLLTGLVVGTAAGAALAIHAASDNALANMKASQDAFCEAHNIPLSECAGG